MNEDGHYLALGVPAGAELDGYNDQLFRPSYTWEDGYSEAFLGIRDDGAVRVLNTRTDQFGGLVDLTLTTDTGQQATLDLSLALGEIGGFGGGNLGVASLRSARSTSGMRASRLHGRTNDAVSLIDTGYRSGDLRLVDAMSDTQYTRLVKSVRENGFVNPKVKYVIIDDKPYTVVGSNRVQAAKQLGRMDELRFQKVEFPVDGTNYYTPEDVLNDWANKRRPKYRGR